CREYARGEQRRSRDPVVCELVDERLKLRRCSAALRHLHREAVHPGLLRGWCEGLPIGRGVRSAPRRNEAGAIPLREGVDGLRARRNAESQKSRAAEEMLAPIETARISFCRKMHGLNPSK